MGERVETEAVDDLAGLERRRRDAAFSWSPPRRSATRSGARGAHLRGGGRVVVRDAMEGQRMRFSVEHGVARRRVAVARLAGRSGNASQRRCDDSGIAMPGDGLNSPALPVPERCRASARGRGRKKVNRRSVANKLRAASLRPSR
jgi:hypothetical protein